MAINWGVEAGAFADGLVKGAETIGRFKQAVAHGNYYQEEADRIRGENPRKDPRVRRRLAEAENYSPAGMPKAYGTAIPPRLHDAPMRGMTSAGSLGVIPYNEAFPDPKKFADGGEVIRARQRAATSAMDPAQAQGRTEQDIFAAEFERLFQESNRVERQPVVRDPNATIAAQQRGRLEERDRAVAPAMADYPQGTVDTARQLRVRDRVLGPALADRPQPASPSPAPQPVIPDAPPVPDTPTARSPAAPTDGVIPGAEAAGAMARPGGPPSPPVRGGGSVDTIGSVWAQVKSAVRQMGDWATRSNTPAGSVEGQPAPQPAPSLPSAAGGATAGVGATGAVGPEPEPARPSPPRPDEPPAPAPAPARPSPPTGGGGPTVARPSPPTGGAPAPAPAGATARPQAVATQPSSRQVVDAQGPYRPGSPISIERRRSTAVWGPEGSDLESRLAQALNGAQRYASRTYQLDESGRVLPDGTPADRAMGQMQVLQGNEAASPQAVAVMDRALEGAAGRQFSEAMKSTMRMLAFYDFYAETGQSEKADRMAFELVQHAGMTASMFGQQALAAARAGNIDLAGELVGRAFNSIPNGQEVRFENGKAVIYDLFTGRPVQELPLDPRLILTLAKGFSDKGATFSILMQRAQRFAASQKGARDPLKDELVRSQIDVNRARVDKLRSGGGGGAAAPSRADYINSLGFRGTQTPAVSQTPAYRPPIDDGTSGEPAGTVSSTDETAGVGSGGPAPAQQTAATTENLSGGEGRAVLAGGEGRDTLSDAAPEPLPEGTQVAQAPPRDPKITPPAETHGVTPGSKGGKYFEPPPFNPDVDIYDRRRASQLGPQGKDPDRGHYADPRDGTVLYGRKHPDYDKLLGDAAVRGISVRPHPKDPKRDVVVLHNVVPENGGVWVREGNTYRRYDEQRDDVLTPSERRQLNELLNVQAEATARGKAGSRDASLAAKNIATWTDEIKRRNTAREKAEAKATPNDLGPAQKAQIGQLIAEIRDPKSMDKTVKPFAKAFEALSDGQVHQIAQNLISTNRLDPREALEMLGRMIQPNNAYNARHYQALGTNLRRSGVVVELPEITGSDGKPMYHGYPNKLLIENETFKAINDAAARNTERHYNDERTRKTGAGISRLWNDVISGKGPKMVLPLPGGALVK